MAEHVCPVWIGYLLASPLRRIVQRPESVVGPYLESGMTVLDVGCAMGFFSIPMARMVGPDGRVVAVDLQEKMLRSLEKRARKAGVSDLIETRACPKSDLGISDLSEAVDFALAFAMVHEVPDARALLGDLFSALRPGGRLLVSEPKGHVSSRDFEETVGIAEEIGFSTVERPRVPRSLSTLFEKRR